MPPGQESTLPEKQEFHQSSRTERGSQGVRARPQEGGDALRLPGTLTDTCAPGECAELPKGCSAHGGTRRDPEQLGGARAAAPRRGLRGGSANPTAQAPEHWAPGHSPGSGLPPEQAEAGRAQDSKDSPARS